jgi:hypothetical protein
MGIRLKVDREPRWVEIGDGAALLVRPATTMLVYAARGKAAALMAQFKQAGEAITAVGGRIEDVPDISDDEREQSALQAMFIVALAEEAAEGWRGVLPEEGDTPLAFDASLLATLFADETRASKFVAEYLVSLHDVSAEGNV